MTFVPRSHVLEQSPIKQSATRFLKTWLNLCNIVSYCVYIIQSTWITHNALMELNKGI